MTTRILCVLALLTAAPALAQTRLPTAYTFNVYQSGVVAPIHTPLSVGVAQITCNSVTAPNGATENPTSWVWNDPANSGRFCYYTDARFPQLPDGSYEGGMTATDGTVTSGETRALFTISRVVPVPPPTSIPAPTGLRFGR